MIKNNYKLNNPEAQIYPIFPQPLFVVNYKGDTTKIKNYFERAQLGESTALYGTKSKDTYILDHPVCNDLKNFITSAFEDFSTAVMRYKTEGIILTQSWLSVQFPNQSHVPHTHPNSIISGVFFFNVNSNTAPIYFMRNASSSNRSYIEPNYHDDFENHDFSKHTEYYSPEPNDLIIFPSYLSHGVTPNLEKVPRATLAINSLTKGTLGNKENLTEVIYNRHE